MALVGGGRPRLGMAACRAFSGSLTVALGGGIAAQRQNFDGTGAHRNWAAGWHKVTDVTKRSGLPNGYKNPYAWMLPQEGGAITTLRHVPTITLEGAGEGALGLNGIASTTITISGTGTGGLIAGGVASATITISGTATGFLGLNGEASATITIGGTADAAAIGHAEASGTIEIDGALVSYAIGHMEATTDFGNDFSPGNLARAVWDAEQNSYDTEGTMGWALKIVRQILQNKTITDPSTGIMTVYDDDNSTVLLQANVFEDTAGGTPYQGTGADRRDRLE